MTIAPDALSAQRSTGQVTRQQPAVVHVIAVFVLLGGSILPELLWSGLLTQFAQILFLVVTALLCRVIPRLRPVWMLACLLAVINVSFLLSAYIRSQPQWTDMFWWAGALSAVAANVTVKMIGIAPVALVLLLLLRTPQRAYLLPGDIERKAEAIPWLGIRGGAIAWGKLAIIAGLLITLGTALLAVVTSIGFAPAGEIGRLAPLLPLIIVLAAVNSYCEGIVFRSAIMAPLRDGFVKIFVLILPALFFGIAHTQGVPGGLLGGVMSAVLGYFMCLSIYETGGFAAGWIIHFLQDVTIFSLLVLLA